MVVDDGNKIVDVAERLGIREDTLVNWVRRYRIERGERAGVERLGARGLVELRERAPDFGWNEICSKERRPSG